MGQQPPEIPLQVRPAPDIRRGPTLLATPVFSGPERLVAKVVPSIKPQHPQPVQALTGEQSSTICNSRAARQVQNLDVWSLSDEALDGLIAKVLTTAEAHEVEVLAFLCPNDLSDASIGCLHIPVEADVPQVLASLGDSDKTVIVHILTTIQDQSSEIR
eukprot:CAMPEP_0206435684 /NCGR_PEP_ID=MMETSP0324_2-20121206/10024_1 /ASSEMBLY_ACC=CAM_ASM_000836 /TAXON_ID=2866 /ORGANISM="Crypthecodinium cohnii, Strain Seligo" /LENGTH=158 /DNA_ID=CAMNT_0053902685 /DNA_START=252 /DNA_END=729 /DNA_ORIENTATION=-